MRRGVPEPKTNRPLGILRPRGKAAGQVSIFVICLSSLVLRALLDCVIATVVVGGAYTLALVLSFVPSSRLGWLLTHVKGAVLVVGGLYLLALVVAALYRHSQVVRADVRSHKGGPDATSAEPGTKG